MIFPFSFLQSAAPPFDPATLAPDSWWRGPYSSGVPLSPTASAGASGSNGTLVTYGNAPSTGAAVDGITPISINGLGKGLTSGTAAYTDLISTSAFTMVVLAKATSSTAAAADYYSDPALFTDANNGNTGLVFTSSGVRAGVYSGVAAGQTTHIPQATGAWFAAVGRYNGTAVKCRVNATDAAPVTTGISVVGPYPVIGRNYNNTAQFLGDVMEVLTWKRELSGTELANLYSYFKATYPSMGLP